MLNYSTNAIEQLTTIDTSRFSNYDLQAFDQLYRNLKQGVKFELPMNGGVLGEDYEKGYDVISIDLLHLPFSVVVLEYPFNYYKKEPGTLEAPKRIAICLDYEANKTSFFCQLANQMSQGRLAETGGIILIGLCTINDLWTPMPFGVALPRYEPDGTNMSVFAYGKNHEKIAPIGMLPFPAIQTAAAGLMELLGPDLAIKNGLRDVGEEITSLVSLLVALSCSNVSMFDVPAPDKLNQKRLKNGKLPFYGYKTVVVDVHRDPTKRGKDGGYSVSDRQSPREHLRRGHIRRLANGKNVWVQAAVIGSSNKGKITQTYKVK